MKLELVGPAVTVSNGSITGEHAFDLACVLLRDGMVDHCILTTADGIVPDLKHVMEIRDEGTGEGAASLLLTTQPAEFSSAPLARFNTGFETARPVARFKGAAPVSLYDTSIIEQVIRATEDPSSSGVSVLKRDGLYSELAWERCP